MGVIEKLTNFQHKDANGKDWGLNVRQRAKELIALVTDTERIRSERQKVCHGVTHVAVMATSLGAPQVGSGDLRSPEAPRE